MQVSSTNTNSSWSIWGPLPKAVSNVIMDYLLPEERSQIHHLILLHSRVNFLDLKVLKLFVKAEFHDDAFLAKAQQIAKRVFEAEARRVAVVKNAIDYGAVFPMNPEVFAVAMLMARNEIAVNLGGASGELTVLLGYSAKLSYHNDINTEEVATYEGLKKEQPADVKAVLKCLPGDCLEILQKQPLLRNRVGLIWSGNMLHFFDNQKMEKLFNLLKDLLKPSGRVILIGNATSGAYDDPACKATFEKYPFETYFIRKTCVINDRAKGTSTPIYSSCVPRPTNMASTTPLQELRLVEKGASTQGQLVSYGESFVKLGLEDLEAGQGVQLALRTHAQRIAQLSSFYIVLYTSHIRLYSDQTLRTLVVDRGFQVESIFHIAKDGHTTPDVDGTQQIGVIASLPSPQQKKAS